MDRHMLKAAQAKAQITGTAMAAAHATAMAASVARVTGLIPVRVTRKSKRQATSRCANPSVQARTATPRCVRISRKPFP